MRRVAVAAALALALGTTGSTAAERPTPTPEPELDLDLALSEPVEDSLYPEVGDPGVDALHYDLDLDWDPGDRVLTGTAAITFRATADAETFQLDLARPLAVGEVTLDGEPVEADHRGKDLVVAAPVREDVRHELVVDYRGRAGPVPARTRRGDFHSLGWTVTPTGEVWTMQEPYGAYSWYPVNDHPSDKALYSFTVHAPEPWTGVANGALVADETADGTRTTRWVTDEPLASYLATIAIGDYTVSRNHSASGLAIDHWYPRGLPGARRDMEFAAEAVDWIEERLGPYPFSTLGQVMTDSRSAMETQTMVTYGNTDYTRSRAVVLHELVHQWWGDQVSPADWSDVWLNEGLTMYLQLLWQAEDEGVPADEMVDRYAGHDQTLRDEAGPPGDYDPDAFGAANIYYPPALMWHELRGRLGEDRFWAVVAGWPRAQDNRSVTREDLYAYVEAETGEELDDFFDAWIMGERTPPREES